MLAGRPGAGTRDGPSPGAVRAKPCPFHRLPHYGSIRKTPFSGNSALKTQKGIVRLFSRTYYASKKGAALSCSRARNQDRILSGDTGSPIRTGNFPVFQMRTGRAAAANNPFFEMAKIRFRMVQPSLLNVFPTN